MAGARTFTDLVAEAEAVPTEGWDFSWFEGRASEARPSWGYQRRMGRRMADARAALDIQTGGGEVLAGVPRRPPLCVATESWPPNVARAAARLLPLGATVVTAEDTELPFAEGAFDLVVSRHPVAPRFEEIARVLRPEGVYFAQHVGPGNAFELIEYFRGPQSREAWNERDPDQERARAEAAGLEIVDVRTERLQMTFYDIGAVVHFLRKVIWTLPDFTVASCHHRLRELHEHIVAQGAFVAHSTRTLFEARKPA